MREAASHADRVAAGDLVAVGAGSAWQMADLEAIHTVEDTETMRTLIVGGAITGIGVFA